MHLAVLVTNTDDSAFARARPLDDAKFDALVREVRPDWRTRAFWVCRDDWPGTLEAFDGVIVTGSPASVNDDAPWVARLETLVRDLIAARVPLFAACFGHQMVARALGTPVLRNPGGWGHGLLTVTREARTPWAGPETGFALYGSHIEQVAALPAGARTAFSGPGVPVAGMAVGDHVFTIQHHPEMTHAFITDLVEEYAGVVGPEVTAAARASLAGQADRAPFAQEIARFFEQAAGAR